jgi:6-phosphofructokinase 1
MPQPPSQIFFSFRFGTATRWTAEHEFMLRIGYWFRVQGIDPYIHDVSTIESDPWLAPLADAAERAAGMVVFWHHDDLGETQQAEVVSAQHQDKPLVFVVTSPEAQAASRRRAAIYRVHAGNTVVAIPPHNAADVAREIINKLAGLHAPVTWVCDDGLPIAGEVRADSDIRTVEGDLVCRKDDIVFPFDYEQRIIKALLHKLVTSETALGRQLIFHGCPIGWPKPIVERHDGPFFANTVKDEHVGLLRDKKDSKGERHVLSAALSRFDLKQLEDDQLAFAEAGPRKDLLYRPAPGRGDLKVGILVSGGIAPGINAVIAGIVERHCLYADKLGYKNRLVVRGFRNGFDSLLGLPKDAGSLIKNGAPLPAIVACATEGGSYLGTSRLPAFVTMSPAERGKDLEHAVEQLAGQNFDILYVIGGDGSMKAAHALSNTARAKHKRLSVIGVPKTIDNDILWVWASFGFQSAVQESTEKVRHLWTEAQSNPRLMVIQLFGSDSGFVVTDAAAASGKCDLFLIPEQRFTMDVVADYVAGTLRVDSENVRQHAVVVMAETSLPEEVEIYAHDPHDPALPEDQRMLLREIGLNDDERAALNKYAGARHLVGPTPDELRSGALKVVSRVLRWKLARHPSGVWSKLRVVTNEPRHLIRSIPPSSSDIIFARRLAYLAVDGALAGFHDFMISQWLTEYVMVPLSLVVLGRKRIPIDGAFYANARASTGQPANLHTASSSPEPAPGEFLQT